VSCLGLPDVESTYTVARNAPGLFQGEKSAAVATHEDGSAVSADAPAKSGELLTIYGTGFGPTERGRPYGLAPPAPIGVIDTATLQVGDFCVTAEKAFAVAGRVGVDAVQFRMPAAGSGDVSVRVTIGGKDSNAVVVPAK